MSPVDNAVVGLGDVGATPVGATRSLGDAGEGPAPCDGGGGVLDAVVCLLTVGMCGGDVVTAFVAFGAV